MRHYGLIAGSLFLAALVGCSAVGTTTPSDAAVIDSESLVIAASENDIQPLAVGEILPTFNVQAPDGSSVKFSANTLARPTVMITYRGGWCPYCNTHLRDLRKILPTLDEKGVDTVFFSGDRPEILLSSLSDNTQESLANMPYQLYSDAQMQAASALGVAFNASGVKMRLLQYIKDTGGSSLENHTALPVPAVFVLDSEGVVRFAHTNPNYSVRMSSDDVLAAVEKALP